MYQRIYLFNVKELAKLVIENAPLAGIQSNNTKITFVAGGYPLFWNGKVSDGIAVGGGTEEADCQIAEYV